MATYIPGIDSYIPTYEPFEPDFKFAQAVLSTRQDRYDTNYKAINDLYGSVVYADLSRQDTQQMRDQFAKQLVPRINQIAELDLSIGANVDQARGVFNPFVENNLVQQDIYRTSRYKSELRRAQSLLNAPNSDASDQYWQTGIDYLNYQMQDFIDASPEDASSKPVPTYVPNVNLYDMALDYLQESGLEVEDFYFTADKKFIIKQKNGELVYDASFERVRRALANNGKVQRAYAADAYVKARNHAEQGVAAGKYQSINEGRVQWAQNLIADITFKAAELELAQQGKTKELKELREKHEAKIKNVGEDRVSPAQRTAYEQVLIALQELDLERESNTELLTSTSKPTQDDEALINRAYAMLMNWNINDDLRAAARSYSMQSASRDIEINDYQRDIEKHKLDMIRDAADRKFRAEQNALNRANALEAARIKAGGLPTDSRLGRALSGLSTGQKDVSYVTDKDGKPLADYNVMAQAEAEFEEADSKIYKETVGVVLDYYQIDQASRGQAGTPETITLPTQGGDKVFTLDEARVELQKPHYKEWVANQYEKINTALATPESRTEQAPNISNDDAARIKNRMNTTQGLAMRVERGRQELNQRAVANWEQLLKFDQLDGVSTINEDINDYGAPSIVQNGKLLSKEEFLDIAVEKARNRQFRDKVRIDEDFYVSEWAYADTPRGTVGYATGRQKFDEEWAREEATKAYNEQYNALNRTLNGYYNGEVSTEAETEAGAERPFKAFGVYSVLRGESVNNMSDENAFMSNSYNSGVIVPQNLNSLSAEQENVLVDLVTQIQVGGVQYVAGDARNLEMDDLTDNVEDYGTKAKRVVGQALMDLDAGSQGSNMKNRAVFSVSYIDAYGAVDSPEKTGAYVITFDQDYLKKLATGDSDDPGYGILTKLEKDKFSTVTLLVNKEEDVSGYSQANYNYSEVDTQIQFDGKYYREVPGAGEFKIWRNNGLYFTSITERTFDPKAGTADHYVSTNIPMEVIRYPNDPSLYGELAGQPVQANGIQQVADYMEFVKMQQILEKNQAAEALYNKTASN